MKQAQFKIRKTSGFSLGELLVTVAILVILMAVALPSVIQIQKNMRQKELDAKAEIIYAAAQNNISKLKAGGKTSKYQYNENETNGVWKTPEIPSDADPDVDNIKEGDICYFTSEELRKAGSAASAIMNTDTVENTLLNNRWVVEYNPSSAIIYAVFYSEDRVNCADDTGEGYKGNYEKYNLLRPREARLADGAKVGYYGGGSAVINSTVTTMTPTLNIINTEKLAAKISCPLPASVSNASDFPVFQIKLTDNAGKTDTRYYACAESLANYDKIQEAAQGDPVNYTLMKRNGRIFTLELVLDDLSSDSTRFVKIYGSKSERSVKLEAGTTLTVTVTAMCPGNYKYTQNLSATEKTNSLFANESTEDTAVIKYARHLQNLDDSSGVVETITKAKQESEITFTNKMPAVHSDQYTDWFETYGTKYFNDFTSGVPNFKPIQNNNLQTYDGDSKRIAKLTAEVDSDAGLFAVLGDHQTVTNVALTGTKVTSTNGAAGALVGNVTGNASIKQCQTYLTASDIKGKDNHDVWIQGKTAGGLIGTVSGNGAVVTNSAASTVVGGHTYSAGAVQSYDSVSAGGLIGSVSGGSVTITGSYADCYLFGKTVGGLVGTSSKTVSVNSCYAAGFATFQTEGAGLVCGAAAMQNSYTILLPTDTDGSKMYYRTATTGSAGHVYYLTDPTPSENTLGTYISEMSTSSLQDVFTWNNATAQPYRLMGQALSAYPYPVLKAIRHYGDWTADFQEGTLVYYEKYFDGSYGFYGANVEPTLKNDAAFTVVGDGYGIVYQKDAGNLPAQVTVTLKNGTSTIDTDTLQISGGSPYLVTTAGDSKQYNIYPLSTDLVNTDKASADYYLKAEIRSETQTDTYYFNPHFAKTIVGPLTDVSAPVPDLTSDSNIVIRTPRHLYMMSLHYDTFANATKGCTFTQERNIDYKDYDWANFSTREDDKRSQAPIAGEGIAFNATYDGGCHWITNVNFTTVNGLYVGFIGQNGKEGTIKDVVLTATYEEESADNYNVRRSGNIQNNQEVYMGVLVGKNTGTIDNCAVSGYYIAGSDGTIHAYENSKLYAGGLVGENGDGGIITNCSADTPALRLSSAFADAYLGGFVGRNKDYISNCYALGHIEVSFAKGGSVSIAGFAGKNNDIIRDSYCATALTSSGENTQSFGFAPLGGRVKDCNYLNNGTYAYINHMYPFNFDACAGTSVTFTKLKTAGVGKQAVNSYNFQNTKTVAKQYPFRAVVQDGAGNLVHYGDWLDDENMGTMGIFYWEHEEYGSNNGYHFTYLGTDETSGTAQAMGGTTLCNAHDDGGVITEYGYGYFELNKDFVTELKVQNATINGKSTFVSTTDTYNQTASDALQEQMHKTLEDAMETQYYFYAFTTRTEDEAKKENDGKGYLCLSGKERNCTWTITQNTGDKKEYIVSPFFANAMSSTDAKEVTAFDGKVTDYSRKPGVGGGDKDNQYEIRSIQQLQYINWYNVGKGNTSTLVDGNTYKQFTYLMYATKTTTNKVSKKEDITEMPNGTVMYWRQTHDVDATGFEGYTPIAGNYNSSSADNYNAVLYAWFGSDYDGESYKIQNISIQSNSYAVGLFGVTVGATIKNVIMYSDNDSEIKRCETKGDDYPDKVGAYALGGLIGVAYDYDITSTSRFIENCAIAGYQIVDDSTNQQGLGEANVGGLTGVANVYLKNCSAVTNIIINSHPEKSAKYGNIIRVGGLTGAALGKVENCYSGGNAKLGTDFLVADTDYSKCDGGNGGAFKSTRVYVGGVIGSGFTSNYRNFTNTGSASDGQPYIKNCYTYFTFPEPISPKNGTAYQPNVDTKQLYCFTVGSLADRAHEQYATTARLTIDNCYYLNNSIERNDVAYIFLYEPYYKNAVENNNTIINRTKINVLEDLSYDEMSNGTLLKKLGGIFEGEKPATGSVTKKTTDFHNVTTTEGSANVPINGKYSFPGSNYALEGKNYPFPAVIQQKDLTFSTAKENVYVFVHYGDWPIDGPYWTRGRDTMDIFADMQTVGTEKWAIKTFYLNPNGKDLRGITKDLFASSSENIAEVMAVGEEDKNTHLYPVTVKAKNTGTAVITFNKVIEGVTYTAEFSLEITANIDIQAEPTSIMLKEGENKGVELTAKSLADETVHLTANDYSTDLNTKWKIEAAEESNENLVTLTQQTHKNIWDVKREGLGKMTLKADFEYTYNGVNIAANPSTTYIDVTQPDTVGLSDGKNQYNMVYLGTETNTVGQNASYGANPPLVEDVDFFLYLDAETLKIEEIEIKNISVNNQLMKQTEKVYEATIGERVFHIELDEVTTEGNYQYIPGSICVTGNENVPDVKLEVTVSSAGRNYTLSITLPVQKAVNAIYRDGNGNEFTKLVPVGNHKLPTQSEAKARCRDFSIPIDQMLAGWRDDTAPETIYTEAGKVYNFTKDVTFTAEWKDIVVTLNANGGAFDVEKETVEMTPEGGKITLSPKPTRAGYAFTGWNTKANGTGTSYHADAQVDISTLELTGYTLYAQWEPYTLTLINDDDPAEFKNVTGMKLSGYNSTDFTRAGYTLDGWYTTTELDGNGHPTGQKVLDANGKVIAAVEDYSKEQYPGIYTLELIGDQKLYACWYRSERYILTNTLRDGYDYLLVSTNEAGEASKTRVAFGPTENPGRDLSTQSNQNSNVSVEITAGRPNYIEKDMSKDLHAVFHASKAQDGSESCYLKNSVGYLNATTKNDGRTNYQYVLIPEKDVKKLSDITTWSYLEADPEADPAYQYNQNVLIHKASDWEDNPGKNTKTRRISYMGRLTDSWAANAFAVKATKDKNTDMYIYEKKPAGYEFSDDTVPAITVAPMFSIRTVAPAKSAALTLADGTRTVLSTAVPSGTAPVTGYTAPTRANSEWTLEGWYTAKDGTGTKVLNADGTATADAGVNSLALLGDTTLYACWMRETDIFVQTDTLEPDADYLLVLGSGEEARAVGQVGETVVRQPVTAHEPGNGSYDVYDTENGDWKPVDNPYITVFSNQTVWHYAVDDEGNGTLTATDGSSRDRALWELADNDISIYRRTAVRERSFEDEYLMLTLCTGTDCITEPVTITDGAWTDALTAAFQKLGLENSGLLGWFDSPDGGVEVLDADGRFAAEHVADYVKDGKWVYDGSCLTLYARVPELPEAETMDAMPVSTDTEEDKKKRTLHQVRLEKIRV